jgi:uncharacterized protein YegP (UPF0339 family)
LPQYASYDDADEDDTDTDGDSPAPPRVSPRHSRFEIVVRDHHTLAGVVPSYHCRFRASNGRIVWTTEPYTRKEAAHEAIRILKQAARSYVDPIVAIRVVTLDERREHLLPDEDT